MVAESKVCTRCGRCLPIDAFYKREKGKRQSHCKQCRLTASKQKYTNDPKVRERVKACSKQWTRNIKAAVIDAYGGCCVCCRETIPEFLTIDHKNEDGAARRRNGERMGAALYSKLKQAGYPKDEYQLLCFNCNAAKYLFGSCPHKHH